MVVDTSIYNALGRGVKTVRDWRQEDEQRAGAAQASELNALNLTNARATAGDNALVRQDQSVIRNALQNVRPGATQEDIAGAYEGTRTPTGLTQAQAIRKAIAEADSLKAKTAASTAAAGASTASQKATEFKLQIDKHNTALNDILSFQTPAEAMESLRRHAAGGQIPPEAVQAMSRELMGMSTPEQFSQWQESKAAGLMDAKSRAELALRRQEAQDRRANDMMIPGANGGYTINQPLLDAKKQVGASSANNVNVKVDAKLGEGVAKEVGPMMASSLESANGAQNQLQTAQQIATAIDSGRVIAGPGASWRLSAKQLGQTLGVGGKDDAEIIANTRQVIQGLAQSTVNARKQVAGQGSLSDNEQALLQRATSGNIDEMTAPEIKQLAQLNMRLSRQVVQQHNKRVEKLKANPATRDMSDFYEPVPLADEPSKPPAGMPKFDADKEARYQAWKAAQGAQK